MTTKKEFQVKQHSYTRYNETLHFETGKLAVQPDGSVTLTYGDNVLLCTTVMERKPRPETDFLPLMIDFKDNFAAAGKIGGAAYTRREGRPSEASVLYCRLTDRALRPLFPKGMINDVVVTITPLSIDREQDLGVLTIVGSSVATMMSGVPFAGPVGAARIAYLDGQYIVNPTKEQLAKSMLNLLVAGPKGSINMIESEADEVPADILKKAFELGQKEIDAVCDAQAQFLAMVTIQPKEIVYNKPSEALIAYVTNILHDDKLQQLTGNSKVPFNELCTQFEKEVIEVCKIKIEDAADDEFTVSKIKMAVFSVIKHFIRHRTIDSGKRIDDRTSDTIRSLYGEVGLLPRVHGSGLFWRGDTQVLTSVTLGSPRDYLVFDTMEEDQTKQRYIHQYNFPPFSTNEARASRGPGRREIGHGKLAEKALERMIPSKEDFPYTIRAVSDCLGSGGSTSMGSVCGSTLALMDAGVPLKEPVSGIAIGLMTYHDDKDVISKYVILTDLMATEDFTGDMDFKVAGTKNGVTAIQLDTKIAGLTMQIIHETIDKAMHGYMQIMDFMLTVMPAPRTTLSAFAPKIMVFKIHASKVKEVIGKGGEMIDKIIEACGGVKIDFEDDGTCFITAISQENIDKAKAMIEEIATDLEIGKIYEGRISRIEEYGVFVELPKRKVGLCHVSALGPNTSGDLNKHFKIGEMMKVKVIEIDMQGKVKVRRELTA